MRILFRQLARRDVHPALQFLKYGVAGGMATAVDIMVFYLLAIGVLQAVGPQDEAIRALNGLYGWLTGIWPFVGDMGWVARILDVSLPDIDDSTRTRNFLITKTLAFFVSNLTAYLLNRWFVFTPGRHSQRKELVLFYTVATASFAVATLLASGMIHFLGISTTLSYGANIVVAVIMNFVCRKFIVFNG